ncbi:MAG TPA: AmmeMemoRadiSam system protein B [Bryobacteraceae bacterium]|jgi:hypothetical protein
MSAVHVSPFSGTWYPAQAVALERLLEERFEASRRRTGPFLFSDALSFIVPHAGPEYSGVVAASVYRSLQQDPPDRIVLLAFPHYGGLRGVAVPRVHTIATPLGPVPVRGFLSERFPRVEEAQVCDHSFEIQLPFLQKAAPKTHLCPLYVGSMTETERGAFAEALAGEWRPGTVFLASSDFTHYGRNFGYVPFPADSQIADRLRALDTECIEAAGSLDSRFFLQTLAETGATVCGTAPIALLLATVRLICPDGLFQATLDYQTSGEITGDFRHTVSYAALGHFPRTAFELNRDDAEALMQSAERTLARLRETGYANPIRAHGSSALESRRGVFVSLHDDTGLLGCMGQSSGREPLADAVPEMALAAALDDPRFHPGDAVARTFRVEISALTPLRRIRAAADFQIGRHGGFLRLGSMAGLLLPQVARQGWSSADFLDALSRKAGLPAQAYQDPAARLSVFEAQILNRTKLTPHR